MKAEKIRVVRIWREFSQKRPQDLPSHNTLFRNIGIEKPIQTKIAKHSVSLKSDAEVPYASQKNMYEVTKQEIRVTNIDFTIPFFLPSSICSWLKFISLIQVFPKIGPNHKNPIAKLPNADNRIPP